MIDKVQLKNFDILKYEIIYLILALCVQEKSYCSEDEESKNPCQCCKMRCWYDIQREAQNILGHKPGTKGDQEAMDVLISIKKCTTMFCKELCPSKKPWAP